MIYDHYYKSFVDRYCYPRTLKTLSVVPHASSVNFLYRGKTVIDFSSSDYLGLSHHPLLIQRSREYAERFGVGCGSSRLVTGNLDIFDEIEQNLACSLGKSAALLLGSGYQTNVSVLQALLNPLVLGQEALVFCDRFCHNSMMTMTRYVSKMKRFRHNDLDHLRSLLEEASTAQNQESIKFILVESIYSMDGDQSNLPALIALAREYQAFLYVDDAHAVGVYGETGWGIATAYADTIPIIMGTFSKALGSLGGYIGC